MTRVEPIAPLSPVALDYARSDAGSALRRSTWRDFVRLGLALPGLVVPFVHFTYGTTPLEAVNDLPSGVFRGDWMIFFLAASFFAAIPIVAWQIRRLAWTASPRRWERTTLATVAVIASVPASAVVGMMLFGLAEEIRTTTQPSLRAEDLQILFAGIAPLTVGFCLTGWRWRRGKPVAAGESLLVTGYLANAAMCFLGFRDDPELGYWLALAPTASFAIALLRPKPHPHV